MAKTVIKVENISKTFRVPHEKHATLKSAALNTFSKKEYSEFKALKGINFEIKKGEFFGIIGKNGCGKSTLLKIMAGIYMPTKGKVKIDGKISPFLELGVGFNPELTARENVFLGGAILGLTRKEIEARFKDIIEFSELEDFVDMRFKNFSSGMQVRLAFSLAIHAHAEILLMDEVLAVGDSKFQKKCFDVFRKFKKQGKTIVFVSHGMGSVEEFCDRVALIDGGKIKDIGDPKKVIYTYKTLNLTNDEEGDEKREIEKKSDKQWGNKKIKVEKFTLFGNDGDATRVFNSMTEIRGLIKISIKGEDIKKFIGSSIIGIGLYDFRGNLVLADSRRLKLDDLKNKKINFSVKLPDLQDNTYYMSVSIANTITKEVYDEHNKKYEIYIKNPIKLPSLLTTKSFWYPDVRILGMMRVWNEEEIIQDTLDHFSKFVDKIIVFDDASTDKTLEIVHAHENVIDVIENKTRKKNRAEEETLNRKELLNLAQKFNPKWIFYADADERFEGDIKGFLKSKQSEKIDGVRISLFDAYMTKDDKKPYKKGEELYNFRRNFGPERRDILMIWRNGPDIRFEGIDAREPLFKGNEITSFYCQHYGKSLSEKHWEETCDYYAENFEQYSEKWRKRKGKAIHVKSDFNTPLYNWEEVKKNSVEIHPPK